MDKNIRCNHISMAPKCFVFSLVLLDVMGLALFMPRQADIDRQFSKDNLNSV